jgi:hypothetical protein
MTEKLQEARQQAFLRGETQQLFDETWVNRKAPHRPAAAGFVGGARAPCCVRVPVQARAFVWVCISWRLFLCACTAHVRSL